MNASRIISEDMTLEEKLEAIDRAMQNAIAEAQEASNNKIFIPLDPAELTMCDGCQ